MLRRPAHGQGSLIGSRIEGHTCLVLLMFSCDRAGLRKKCRRVDCIRKVGVGIGLLRYTRMS